MIKPANPYQLCCFIWVIFVFAGCAHVDAPGKSFAEKTVRVSSTFVKRGDLANAVEELKIALAADPDNPKIRNELSRLIVKRDQEAQRHFKAGIALKDSNPPRARKKFLEALRIRSDYPEAIKALRELRLESAESAIHKRLKKEARLAAVKEKGETEAAEDETDGEEYSLDIAITSFDSGDFDTAIHEFEKMKARYPSDPDIQSYLDRSWYNAGITWFTKKDYSRALASFAKVPKGFERVDEYLTACRTALRIPEEKKPKPAHKKRR